MPSKYETPFLVVGVVRWSPLLFNMAIYYFVSAPLFMPHLLLVSRHSFSFLLEKNIISYYHRIESENGDSSLANEGTVYSGRLEINKAIEECRAKGTAISAPQRP